MLVHLNIGSNQNKELNTGKAINLLAEKFGEITTSKTFKSKSIGFDGEDFYNIGVNLETLIPPKELVKILRKIEDTIGRERNMPKFSSRSIDIDIIFYGDKIIKELNIPREDILKYQFVLTPYMEILGK